MIHETAIIDPKAIIAEDVEVGPWTIIGPDVTIGAGSKIASHVVIKGPTTIGKNNHIFQFASVGDDPQDMKYQGEQTFLEIGDNNTIRENCTINRGTEQGGGITRVGNHSLFMAYVHIAHDCMLGDHVVFANNASLAGHVKVNDHVVLGGFSAVRQFITLGEHSFIAGGTMIVKDVLPYVLIAGTPATTFGLNAVGLKRRGFTADTISFLRRAYKVIYRQGLTVKKALQELDDMVTQCPEINIMIEALRASSRGIIR